MKQTDPSPNHRSETDWQMLGRFELRIDEKADGAVRAWVTQTLTPLNLNVDFANKILRSAQEAVTRVAIMDGAAPHLEHVHLLIYAPTERISMGKTWGFFRIEKLENTIPDKAFPDHAIEFYLYVEGE